MDYEPGHKIWSVMQQCVYKTCVNNLDERKQRLIEVWKGMQLNIVDAATGKWRKQLQVCAEKRMVRVFCIIRYTASAPKA